MEFRLEVNDMIHSPGNPKVSNWQAIFQLIFHSIIVDFPQKDTLLHRDRRTSDTDTTELHEYKPRTERKMEAQWKGGRTVVVGGCWKGKRERNEGSLEGLSRRGLL